MTATPLQVAQMAAVIANGGFLYRPSIIHHMTDDQGRVVFTNDTGQITARAEPSAGETAVVTDAEGNVIQNPDFAVEFDAEGNYIFQPEVVDALEVNREYIEIVAEALALVNVFVDEDEFYTGATYVDWPTQIRTAGKTGTAEFCDNIAIERGWCSFDDIALRRILPTHSWYVGYAPADEPEIVVSAFLYHGGEGSQWAAPVACNVMAAYLRLGQYAPPELDENGNPLPYEGERVCNSLSFNPQIPPELLVLNQDPIPTVGDFGP